MERLDSLVAKVLADARQRMEKERAAMKSRPQLSGVREEQPPGAARIKAKAKMQGGYGRRRW